MSIAGISSTIYKSRVRDAKNFGMLLALVMAFACIGDSQATTIITHREMVEIRSLAEAEEHSVVIAAVYDPDFLEFELLICIPQPSNAPEEVSADFIFGAYDDKRTPLFMKSMSSVIEGEYETFYLATRVDFLETIFVSMAYSDTKDFRASGNFLKHYRLYFSDIASELIRRETKLNADRKPGSIYSPPPTCD